MSVQSRHSVLIVSITRSARAFASGAWKGVTITPPRGGRKPRFALGQSRYDRPMLSLLYLVVRALVRLLVSAGRAGRVDRVDALFAPVTIMP